MVARRKKLALWWRRTGMALRVTVFLAAAFFLALLMYWQRPREEPAFLGQNLLVFILVNLNIVVLCVLAFLIGRNIVKLIFDRRRNILGSKLKLRLVVAFVGLTLVPTTFLFLLASGLLNRAMDGWFSSQVEASVSGAVEVARHHYGSMKESAISSAARLKPRLTEGRLASDASALESWLEQQRKEERLFAVTILRSPTEILAGAQNAAAAIPAFGEPEPNEGAVRKALAGVSSVLFEENEGSQFVRAYESLDRGENRLVLITTLRVNPELSQALAVVNDSFKDYEQLKLFKAPLKSGYLLTLSMITSLILFSAIWIAFYIAREMVGPIQRLAEGTRAVARGNYDFQIRASGDDELGLLVKSFNTMTTDLRLSRREGESRRLYIETILANLAVGIIGVDTDFVVTSVNDAAARLFGLQTGEPATGKSLTSVLPAEVYEQVRPLIDRVDGGGEARTSEREISVQVAGQESKVICTVGRINDGSGRSLGLVLLFDDITELAKAQHMSVWREVARRIAHEIKNPLTPIQLSAQRLQKLLPELKAPPSVHECAETIVENVASIKLLANEFSNFARMPTAEFRPSDLNAVLSSAISPFAESRPDIIFQFLPDTKLPELMIDREQIRRLAINLLDNAITALSREDDQTSRSESARIMIKTTYDPAARNVTIEVADNGPGIPPSDKVRVFEPYFTTKASGSGLGLAIVTSIVSDHHGQIRVYDNKPRGAKFVIELPESPRASTQRRFAQ